MKERWNTGGTRYVDERGRAIKPAKQRKPVPEAKDGGGGESPSEGSDAEEAKEMRGAP